MRASVSDGYLTLDAAGGTNTKINYVEIVDADNTLGPSPASIPATTRPTCRSTTSISLSPSHAVEQTT